MVFGQPPNTLDRFEIGQPNCILQEEELGEIIDQPPTSAPSQQLPSTSTTQPAVIDDLPRVHSQDVIDQPPTSAPSQKLPSTSATQLAVIDDLPPVHSQDVIDQPPISAPS